MIDWREMFKGRLNSRGGEMRGFYIVFNLRMNDSGKLIFWDDDGCRIRRNGALIHCDPSAHTLTRHEIDVTTGDHLEVAQWQLCGEWLWGAWLRPQEKPAMNLLLAYLNHALQRLQQPNGPPLKMYSHGRTPIRTIVSLYSMILNGYSPSKVFIFGESQWSKQTREIFAETLPFAETITTTQVLSQIQSVGGTRLVELAQRYWFVMKTCISLLHPPEEFCLMDDDVFVLDRVDDALEAFQQHDLVFAPDTDHGKTYLAVWGRMNGLSALPHTGTFNAGLFWMRNHNDQQKLASFALQAHPNTVAPFVWEQGFIAALYARRPTLQLPTQRYFYPLFDGLPGGLMGYDYANNPCGFASIHYGGLADKPSERVSLFLAPKILGRHAKMQTVTKQSHAMRRPACSQKQQ
ncbi:MAG: hypothetical protein ONB46_10580 [candidate division KSB1 bacterium]|nr:hypothetical protein [candidate division KSB1 bacterium]MDZ7366250.1 hypothetical protein [candidate division KSB1 bacterium]MDZ7404468.1 hypothetical protein [candidate division KSB1 bacterium]